jgi:hypothetical protein
MSHTLTLTYFDVRKSRAQVYSPLDIGEAMHVDRRREQLVGGDTHCASHLSSTARPWLTDAASRLG